MQRQPIIERTYFVKVFLILLIIVEYSLAYLVLLFILFWFGISLKQVLQEIGSYGKRIIEPDLQYYTRS
jgi:hypothetical protein